MAKKQNVIDRIRGKINANGTGAIDGPLLQEIMLLMIEIVDLSNISSIKGSTGEIRFEDNVMVISGSSNFTPIRIQATANIDIKTILAGLLTYNGKEVATVDQVMPADAQWVDVIQTDENDNDASFQILVRGYTPYYGAEIIGDWEIW